LVATFDNIRTFGSLDDRDNDTEVTTENES